MLGGKNHAYMWKNHQCYWLGHLASENYSACYFPALSPGPVHGGVCFPSEKKEVLPVFQQTYFVVFFFSITEKSKRQITNSKKKKCNVILKLVAEVRKVWRREHFSSDFVWYISMIVLYKVFHLYFAIDLVHKIKRYNFFFCRHCRCLSCLTLTKLLKPDYSSLDV